MDPKRVERALRDLLPLLVGTDIDAPACSGKVDAPGESERATVLVEPFDGGRGLAGVGLLGASHCAIHTWPLRPFFALDACSSHGFESSALENHLAKSLGAYDLQVTDVSFALKYEADVRGSVRKISKVSGREGLRGWSSKRAG